MSYAGINDTELFRLRERLEKLNKSFNAVGYQGMNNAGKTGVSALSIDNIDPVMYHICATEQQLKLMKNISTVKASSSVYAYKVQTSIATQGLDLSGFENFMPQEDFGNYEDVREPLKIYGIKKTLGDMARLTNEAGGFFDGIDIEKENEKQAAMALSVQFERDGYVGGDYFINAAGAIDYEVPLRFYGRRTGGVRNMRGIQANIREGDVTTRGVTTDFIAYGNSMSVVHDNRGARLDQDVLDDVATSVTNNAGRLGEAHATPAQISEFRKAFYGMQRGDIASNFAIRGPDVANGEDDTFSVTTVSGSIKFVPSIYKNAARQKAIPVSGTNGRAPNTPVITSTTEVTAATLGKETELRVGDQVRFLVQAGSIFGLSMAAQTAVQTVAAAGSGFDLVIAAQADAEKFVVFMTPREAKAKPGSEGFVGQVLAAPAGATTFRYASAIIPGLESVLFLPAASEERVKLAVLGNLVNKSDLGRNGLALESVFSSYLCLVLPKPRSSALLDNVAARRRI